MNVVVVKRTESIGGGANVVLQALMQYCKGEKHNVGCSYSSRANFFNKRCGWWVYSRYMIHKMNW